MQSLAELVASRQEWLMNRVIRYAQERGYAQYASTLAEAWRLSIAGLSTSIIDALHRSDVPPELSPDDDYTSDPIAAFGIEEARRHRQRGVTLAMFLGLMKYFRQGYLDLIAEAGWEPQDERQARRFLERFFDRVELGFCVEWSALSDDAKTRELQSTNRRITNERSRYITIFETLRDPVILLDRHGNLDNFNRAASDCFDGLHGPGAAYYGEPSASARPGWLTGDQLPTASADGRECRTERELPTKSGPRRFLITAKRLLDVSDPEGGTLLIFTDVTEHEHARYLVHYRGELARLVSEISSDFVGLPLERTDEAIDHALERIGTFMGVESAYAFRFSEDHHHFSMTHLWQPGPEVPTKEQLQEVDAYTMPWWMSHLEAGEVVAIRSADDLPPEADVEKSMLQWLSVVSLLSVPLSSHSEVIGFFGLATLREPRRWSDDEMHLLKILGQVLTNALRHQKAEQILAQERQLLRTVIDNLPDYIYVKDRNSRFVLNNAAHVRLLKGRAGGDITGKTDFAIFPETLAAGYYDDEQTVMRTGQPLLNREEVVIDERGHKQWALTTKVPLRDAHGNSIGIVGITHNITERKRMEEAIEEHARLLGQANADLRRRNQDLDEFTYVASHDLQEPLRKLIAFSEALQVDLENDDREGVHRDIEIISSGARRMQQLVQDLLALSRSGRQKMNLQPVPLNRCVDAALDALELRVRETGAQIEHGRLPVVRGDLSLLTQLYQNLIGNALKFHRDEAPHVQLVAEPHDEGWLLAVRDNGIGIKSEYAEQIFAPFRRLHGRGRYEGTGIGLAICRKIVERHGGKIWVESAPGEGSCFKFTLMKPQEDNGT